MNNKFYLILSALAVAGFFSAACTPADNDTDDPGVIENFLVDPKVSVPVNENWVFDKRPALVLHVENPNGVPVLVYASLRISTDMGKVVTDPMLQKEVEAPALGSIDITFTTNYDLDPGIYKAATFVDNRTVKLFNFAVNPLDIKSPPDKLDDFDSFWNDARNQLPELNENNVTVIEIAKKSNSNCKVYFVEIPSVPDGLDGDPVIVRGYYLEPQDGKKHPVIMHFQGYDTQPNPPKMSCPSGNSGNYAEFYLSHRGQYINSRPASKREDGIEKDFENIYGDWFAFNFGDKDGYYYRGAFMDCVQAVRFMATRETSDMGNLFAEGSSQGGALCYAAAALSDYPFTAIAPNVAFLGDFPDYFKIVGWPGDTAKSCAKAKGMTDQEMYAFLSYFDTKNLATRISCAVWATSGLQDGTCPPHTNLAPFNNLKSTDKTMNFYPEMQHSYPSTWYSDISKFFKDRTK